ncbi:MAG TPA: hypothetical protein VI197_22965 [Polyangiaceae bacterium]
MLVAAPPATDVLTDVVVGPAAFVTALPVGAPPTDAVVVVAEPLVEVDVAPSAPLAVDVTPDVVDVVVPSDFVRSASEQAAIAISVATPTHTSKARLVIAAMVAHSTRAAERRLATIRCCNFLREVQAQPNV